VRETVRHRAIDVEFVELCEQAILSGDRAFRADGRFPPPFHLAKFSGLSETHDSRHVERARTHAALVAAAVNLCRKLHAWIAPPHVQGAAALRA